MARVLFASNEAPRPREERIFAFTASCRADSVASPLRSYVSGEWVSPICPVARVGVSGLFSRSQRSRQVGGCPRYLPGIFPRYLRGEGDPVGRPYWWVSGLWVSPVCFPDLFFLGVSVAARNVGVPGIFTSSRRAQEGQGRRAREPAAGRAWPGPYTAASVCSS